MAQFSACQEDYSSAQISERLMSAFLALDERFREVRNFRSGSRSDRRRGAFNGRSLTVPAVSNEREEKPGKGWGRPCTTFAGGGVTPQESARFSVRPSCPQLCVIEHGPSAAIYARFWRGAAAQSARHRPSWRRLHSERPVRRLLPHSDRLRETCAIRACLLSLIDLLPFRHG
jgi:hypothetical protein